MGKRVGSEWLLLDEPFGALAAQTRTVMQEELLRVGSANQRTVMSITHADEEAPYLADRMVVMTRRPAAIKEIKEIIDVKSLRDAENWQRYERIKDVMDQASFVHLKTRIWRLLREQHDPGAH